MGFIINRDPQNSLKSQWTHPYNIKKCFGLRVPGKRGTHRQLWTFLVRSLCIGVIICRDPLIRFILSRIRSAFFLMRDQPIRLGKYIFTGSFWKKTFAQTRLPRQSTTRLYKPRHRCPFFLYRGLITVNVIRLHCCIIVDDKFPFLK